MGYLLIRAVSFLLLPLYTNIFSTEEFGVFSLIFIFIAFSQFFYSYGMDASLMKFFVKNKNHKQIYSSIFITLFFSSSFLSTLIWIFSEPLSLILLKANYSNLFKISSLILFLDSFSFRVLVIHRMEGRPYRYLSFVFLNVLISFISNYYLILKLNWGIEGALYSTLLGSISIFIFSLPILLNRVSINNFSFSTLKRLMIFGFPFLPSIIFQLIIDFSDRQMLAYITDLKTVGIYSSSYKIASIMLLLISGFRLGWEPFFLKLKNNKSLIISSVSNFVMFFLITVLLFIILFIEPIIIYSNHILPFSIIGENFWSSLPIIPIIMFGYLFLALYHLQMPGIFYYNKTFFLPFFRFLGALSNILLNLILIPYWGIYGAAIATSLSFAIMTMPMFIYTNRLFQIKYNWLFICLYLLYTLFVYSLNSFYIITIIPAILLFSIGLFIILYQLKKTHYLLLNYL